MKLPDKVYLNKFMIRPGMLHPAQFPPDEPEEAYIRKEALLEWANGMMDCFAPGGDCSQTLQMVIKHIESL